MAAATTPRARRVDCAVKDLPAALAGFDLSEPTLILVGQTMVPAAQAAAQTAAHPFIVRSATQRGRAALL